MMSRASTPVRSVNPDVDRADDIFDGQSGMSRYVQLASVLRRRIAAGEWRVGQRLPTVHQLATDFGLAKVTVRQALAVLAREQLITVQRARGSYVCAEPTKPNAELRAAISDVHVGSSVFKIHLLEAPSVTRLPAELREDVKASDKYVRVRKLHLHDGEPFCLADIYVLASLFRKFPKGSERTYKIVRLIREFAGSDPGILHQTMTVEPADYDLARVLNYSFAGPVARIRRVTFGVDGTVLMAGLSCYRGDRFVLDIELPNDVTAKYPAIAIPARRKEKPTK
jgi:GntR family transcriptional regulator